MKTTEFEHFEIGETVWCPEDDCWGHCSVKPYVIANFVYKELLSGYEDSNIIYYDPSGFSIVSNTTRSYVVYAIEAECQKICDQLNKENE